MTDRLRRITVDRHFSALGDAPAPVVSPVATTAPVVSSIPSTSTPSAPVTNTNITQNTNTMGHGRHGGGGHHGGGGYRGRGGWGYGGFPVYGGYGYPYPYPYYESVLVDTTAIEPVGLKAVVSTDAKKADALKGKVKPSAEKAPTPAENKATVNFIVGGLIVGAAAYFAAKSMNNKYAVIIGIAGIAVGGYGLSKLNK